jgi:succinate dehydrogenase flavin-adding protein (antitoxin of CptAB toxin-antitoxin module)
MSKTPKANRRAKSNRAQADYFELLTCQYICHLYNIRFSYSKNLALLSNKVLKLPDGSKRMELQNSNFLKLEPELKEILEFETDKKGRIIEVLWVGRNLAIKTTSDVDAEHITKELTRFSIKSIKGDGTGTVKNLGMKSLERYLKIDFSQENKIMWEKLREYTQEFDIPKAELKKKVNKRKKLLKWAQSNGRDYQIKLNELCYKSFNNLMRKEKVNFLNFILDADDKDLYVIIVNDGGVVIYKPIEDKLGIVDKIEAKKSTNSDVGYSIFINGVPTYRIQTNNTNGIGISPFCQRVFKI